MALQGTKRAWFMGLCIAAAALTTARLQAQQAPESMPQGDLRRGRELLMARQFASARQVFARYLHSHPNEVQAELGLGDAELGLREFEAAEATYRQVTNQRPQLWAAHKNLVVVEAALGRWEEFDRERTVLRMARERGAPGISVHESDVIDSFTAGGGRWVVRAYFVPVGRSAARLNFEHFSENGRVEAYLSLEDAGAAQAALTPGDVHVGEGIGAGKNNSGSVSLTLNWYTGAAHGSIHQYSGGEPRYEQVRGDAIRWIETHPHTAIPGS